MSQIIEAPPRPVLGVEGAESKFPVNNIYCVGRNYADHAIEMGGDPDREPPFFFMKPGFAILNHGQVMQYPALSADVHHEVEMVIAIGAAGEGLAVGDAMSLVFGYGVGVDMTRRDLQAEAKKASRPWESGKTFVHAAPCGDLTPLDRSGELNEAPIALSINGEVRQQGNINQMIWKVPEIISRLSTLFLLQAGDLIYTGTPAGVGPVNKGDQISATIGGLAALSFSVSSS